MIPELAGEYFKRRMSALGYIDNYVLDFKHFVLAPAEYRVINAGRHLYLLICETDYIRIESDVGLYDLAETNVNELRYEHSGTICITNQSSSFQHLRMIQAIITKY